VALASFTLPDVPTLAIAGTAQLRDRPFTGTISLICWMALAKDPTKPTTKRPLQSPGTVSRVYVPALARIFKDRYRKGASTIIFPLDDIRNACESLNVASRNPADVIYACGRGPFCLVKSVTSGFHVLRPTGRGQCALEKATSTIFEGTGARSRAASLPPSHTTTRGLTLVVESLDRTRTGRINL
jgi:hypothetical protein